MRFASCLLLPLAAAGAALCQTPERPVRSVTDPGVVTTRQNISPAGAGAVFQGRVYGVDFGENSEEVWVFNAGQVFRFGWRENKVLGRIPLRGSPGLQGVRFDIAGGGPLATVAQPGSRRPSVQLLTLAGGRAEPVVENLGSFIAGAPAVAAKADAQGRRIAVVPLIYDNQLAVIDLAARKVVRRVPTGIAPFGAAINAAGTTAWVTNWGGRLPKPGDLTAATGLDPAADRVVVDSRGIASTGTVTRADLATGETKTIAVDLHPTAIVYDEARGRLYVANSNKDSVSVIDAASDRVLSAIPIEPFTVRAPGIAPTALALSPDGARLWVACGGINAIAAVNTAARRVEGLIPTGWYPNGLAASRDGKFLAVTTLLGPGSGWREEPRKRFVHANRGSVSVIDVPDKAQLAGYTTVVAENNHLAVGPVTPPAPRTPARTAASPVPVRSGDPSLIEHVVYVIKENRTYDQLFGDLEKGNGDPSLVMFGADVTPNQRRLAEQLVVLDNFYASGGNSADGHQWATQANEVSYCLWPGYLGRSYPFDGSDPIAYSSGGFIWDAALRMKKTVRIFGEYAGRLALPASQRAVLLERWRKGDDFASDWNTTAPIEPLNKILARNYPPYTTIIPDVARARIFLAELKTWEASGSMPNLVLIQLPSDHTNGASPGISSAKAMVADNDLATGQIVEALSRTPFWKKMAIFIVEDDAQNGVDHVDGHRTVALVASPYAKRGAVDSTFYSHQSILKTIELMLGLPALSIFDLIAHDMRASFTSRPDFTGYTAVEPKQSLFEMNPPLKSLRGAARQAALDSMRMRWDVPDAVPTERLNRILWRQVRGWNTPYPAVRRAVFTPMSVDVDDDERE